VTRHGRKYGEKESHPVPIWNGIFEHYKRIGDAIWEFEKCIDWITEERDGVGIVLGGKPVKVSEIVAEIKGSKKETVRRHMDALERENFIRRRRTPYGHVIEVLNSHKFGIWKHSKEKPQNDVSLPQEKPIHGSEKPIGGSEKPKNSINKEDSAVTQHKDAAVEAPSPLNALNPWELLGSDLPMGSTRFQQIFEHYAATRNGNCLSETMERTIQASQKRGIKVPPPFFDAKRVIERREIKESVTVTERPELEELPWQMR
jgi:hypothetical protein